MKRKILDFKPKSLKVKGIICIYLLRAHTSYSGVMKHALERPMVLANWARARQCACWVICRMRYSWRVDAGSRRHRPRWLNCQGLLFWRFQYVCAVDASVARFRPFERRFIGLLWYDKPEGVKISILCSLRHLIINGGDFGGEIGFGLG